MHSYYWQGCELDDPELAAAHERIASASGSGDRDAAFLGLLHSADPVAVGIALDHYRSAEATGRFGMSNPFAAHSGEVLRVARKVLDDVPSPASLSPFTGEGANHASALFAMTSIAEAEDAGRIAHVLETSTNSEVRNVALDVAREVVWQSETPDPSLIGLLRRIALDRAERQTDRLHAIGALGSARVEEAISALLLCIEDDDVKIQATAALELAEDDLIDQHRELLERLVNSWPDDAPYPVSEIRHALAENS